MLAGLAAAKHAAVSRLVVETSFLPDPAFAGLPTGLRRDPGIRSEHISSPDARQAQNLKSMSGAGWG
jgi:hypothetical protein